MAAVCTHFVHISKIMISLLINNKEKSNTLEKNGVYKIHCAECDAIYIGQCGRALKHRISEHKVILTNTANTDFCRSLLTTQSLHRYKKQHYSCLLYTSRCV